MTKTIDNIVWRMPWRPLNHPLDRPALQRQLERELAEGHPLWGKDTEVVGRRVDSDDVLVLCSDGTMVVVHLDWATGPHKNPAEYPSVIACQSLIELQQVIDSDAHDYGDDD
jgi:hypothetical protein